MINLETVSKILYTAAGISFISAVIYAVKYRVITSLLFELEQKKLKNSSHELVIAGTNINGNSEISALDPEHKKLTETISTRKKSANTDLINTVTVIKNERKVKNTVSHEHDQNISDHTDKSPDISDKKPALIRSTVPVKKRKNTDSAAIFSITQSITVIPCSEDELRCIDEA